ncbi:MAG: FAD-dependent oxidoreductase [Candidatus Ozemobacteraceae bacterium]
MRVGIIGAGPAGLTAAYQLIKAGIHVDVFEETSVIGGMCRTINMWNQRVDLGPHRFFTHDARVRTLWEEVVGSDFAMVQRLTRILYNDALFFYPLKPLDTLRKLGPVEAAVCVLSYMRRRLAGSNWPYKRNLKNHSGCPVQELPRESFEDWVIERFGRRLFEMFFKTYSEKLWGMPCSELDADFSAQRIRRFSLWEAIKNAFFVGGDYADSKWKHSTLLDQFAYPHLGSGAAFERMGTAIEKRGGRIFCSTPVCRVVSEGKKAIGVQLADGTVKRYDQVVSTMSLPTLVEGLSGVPDEVRACAAALHFRQTILVYLLVAADDLFPDNWLYVHSKNLKTGRITNFRNWTPHLYGEDNRSVVVLEYWDDQGRKNPAETVGDDAHRIATAIQDFQESGFLGESLILDASVYRLDRSYPIYRKGYKEVLQPVERYLQSISGLSVIGRGGAFKYNNQDHSMLMGLLAAENLTGVAQHDLWSVNTDYGEYQEK